MRRRALAGVVVAATLVVGACSEPGKITVRGGADAPGTAPPVAPPDSASEERIDLPARVSACKTDAAAIQTAYAASAVTSEMGTGETMRDFLADPTFLYFAVETGPTTGPVARLPESLRFVSEAQCPPVDVPLGSI